VRVPAPLAPPRQIDALPISCRRSKLFVKQVGIHFGILLPV
jgi:hypothetical protein